MGVRPPDQSLESTPVGVVSFILASGSGVAQLWRPGHIRTPMKTIIVCLLSCLSAFAGDTNEIHVVTRTDAKVSPGFLVTYEEFNRNGQTNLLRITIVKDGVTNNVAHNFYYRGAYLGRYSQGGGYTLVSTAPSAPCVLAFVWDSSNQIRIASVTTTNYVTLDSFTFTNGIFYPDDSSRIEETNKKTRDLLHR